MDFNSILQHIQSKLGKPPRNFNFVDKLTWYKQDFPQWDWQDDDIRIAVHNWDKAFRHGILTWGHIVQVNTLMFKQGKENCPGEMLLWLDSLEDFDPYLFEDVATDLFELKGNSKDINDPDEKKFAEHLEDEYTREYGLEVPESICDGLHLRVSTIFFQRRHLPEGLITTSLFPVLYLPENPMVTVVVPAKFWPKEFVESF